MTRKEVMEKLKKNENDIGEAVKELLEEMCPFDINDEEALKIENRLERLQKPSHNLECKLCKMNINYCNQCGSIHSHFGDPT